MIRFLALRTGNGQEIRITMNYRMSGVQNFRSDVQPAPHDPALDNYSEEEFRNEERLP